MKKQYSVEAFDKGNLIAVAKFAKPTPRESIMHALGYCEYLTREGFSCKIKCDKEIVAEFNAINV